MPWDMVMVPYGVHLMKQCWEYSVSIREVESLCQIRWLLRVVCDVCQGTSRMMMQEVWMEVGLASALGKSY